MSTPELHKTVVQVDMAQGQAGLYSDLEEFVREVLADDSQSMSHGRAIGLLLSAPDRIFRSIRVRNELTGELRFDGGGLRLADGETLPKEEWLRDRLLVEEGKALVCVRSMAVAERLQNVMDSAGVSAGTLNPGRPAHVRQQVIDHIADTKNALITRTDMIHPGIMAGYFQSIYLYEPETSLYKVVNAVEQVYFSGPLACDVEEVHLAYAGTLQPMAAARNHFNPDFKVEERRVE